MFWHVFRYRLLCLLRDRITVFWTLIFPLFMATLFYFSFGHITSDAEQFLAIETALVDNAAYREDTRFQEVLKAVSAPASGQFLELTVTTEEKAQELLDKGAVAGIITLNPRPELIVRKVGLSQTILKAFLDDYIQTEETITRLIRKNPMAVGGLLSSLKGRESVIEEITFSQVSPDTGLGYFYALIAMACLYSSFWGLRNTEDIQANETARAARRSVAPTHKLAVVLWDSLAALSISLGEVLVLLAYLSLALGVKFGNQLGLILLACLVGCIAGVSLGMFIGTVVGGGQGVKIGVLLAASMIMSFLSGLMFAQMKEIIARKAPFLSYINLGSLITDSFYSLYVFDNHRRFFLNLGLLSVISAILNLVSFFRLRRERYASI